jgi:hypothetical protein
MTITCPRPTDSDTRYPVMVWVHGYVLLPKVQEQLKLMVLQRW